MQQKTLKWYLNVENLIRQAQTFTANANLAHLFRKLSVNPYIVKPYSGNFKVELSISSHFWIKKKKKYIKSKVTK